VDRFIAYFSLDSENRFFTRIFTPLTNALLNMANPFINTTITTINILSRKNYEEWCFKARVELGSELYGYVDGSRPQPGDDATAAQVREWEKKDREAKKILLPTITGAEWQLIRGCETAHEM